MHRNTIIKAYSHLRDQELIDSLQGVGYRVTYKSESFYEPDVRRKVNWSTIIKDEYQDMEKTFDDIFLRFTEENNISFSTGMPPAIYDEEDLATDLAAILREEGRKPFFLPISGDLTLRHKIVPICEPRGSKLD